MKSKRLLLWLKAIEEDPQVRLRDSSSSEIIAGIMEHLQKLLNTRQGSVDIAVDYGLPDLTDLLHSYPESIRDIERELKNTISKFEPRLKAVRVKFIPNEDNPLELHFEINAQLSSKKKGPPIVFESILDPDGRVNIKA